MSLLADVSGASLTATDGVILTDSPAQTGSQTDFARRLRGLLPGGWFPLPPASGGTEQAPVLVGVLNGFGAALAAVWTLLGQVQSQTRLATASGIFIDAFADDYFGVGGLPRQSGETDAAYAARIKASLIAQKNTRAAVSAAVAAVAGAPPTIIEPMNANDCHATASAASPAVGGGYGYGCAGLRTGTLTGGQFFLIAGNPGGAALNAIYAAVESAKAEGVIAWTQADAAAALGEFVLGDNTVS